MGTVRNANQEPPERRRLRSPVAAARQLDTISTKLPNGRWIAVELRPGSYATAATKAAAEAAIRRKLKKQSAARGDEDAIDLAIIRKRQRNARLSPFETLKRELEK